ncbi:MAG: hypothetical protein OEV44_08410 [Spirochaetota bacterium]|nr:hypothetical protein [Spirochaetota bacterium]
MKEHFSKKKTDKRKKKKLARKYLNQSKKINDMTHISETLKEIKINL